MLQRRMTPSWSSELDKPPKRCFFMKKQVRDRTPQHIFGRLKTFGYCLKKPASPRHTTERVLMPGKGDCPWTARYFATISATSKYLSVSHLTLFYLKNDPVLAGWTYHLLPHNKATFARSLCSLLQALLWVPDQPPLACFFLFRPMMLL